MSFLWISKLISFRVDLFWPSLSKFCENLYQLKKRLGILTNFTKGSLWKICFKSYFLYYLYYYFVLSAKLARAKTKRFNCFTGTMYKSIIFFGIFPSISANTTLYLKQLGRGNVHGFILLHCNGCFMSRTTAQWAFL